MTTPQPLTLRLLSLGAGVQSTTLLLLSALGELPRLDGAIFADTGWEPRAVYVHLDRLEREVAQPAGIPIWRVSAGNIRADALDPAHRFASMPLYVRNPDGGDGMIRRQCTSEYKIKPIKAKVRELLGAGVDETGRLGRVPAGRVAEQWIGISVDEIHRAKDSDVTYIQHAFPLLDLGWRREDCVRFLRRHGYPDTPKSACIGCPFHTNAEWRRMRDERPEEWADAVAFDHAIRAGAARATATGSPLLGEAYLHRSRLPLDQAPIDRVTAREWRARQATVFDLLADDENDTDETGCSPFTCRAEGMAV